MAIRPLNSVAGFSVGEIPANVILPNTDIFTTNITVSNRSNLGPVANVFISGGSNGQVISTDGAGNLSFATISTSSISNGNSNVVVVANANVNISSAGNANILTVTGTGVNIAGTANVSGNANVGNLGATTVVATTGNITTINSGLLQNSTSNIAITSGGNITIGSAGNAAILTVTGTGVNVTGTLEVTANITAPQIISNISTGTAPFVVTSTTKVANLNADTLDGYDTASANTASTIALRDSSGNLAANYFIGNGSQLSGINPANIANGTSSVNIPAVNGNVLVSVGATANSVIFTPTGVNIAGTANIIGNANIGNVGTGNLVAGNVNSNAVVGTGLTLTSTGNLYLSPSSNVVMNSKNIKSLANPVTAQDAATKYYVDNAVSAGIDIHTSANTVSTSTLSATYTGGGTNPTWTDITTANTLTTGSAHGLSVNDVIVFTSGTSGTGLTASVPYFVFSVPTTTTITLTDSYSGEQINTLSDGTGLTVASAANTGVGATLTSTTNTTLTVNGVTCALNDRVLVTAQSTATQNGIYYITQVGSGAAPWILTRTTDGNKYVPNSPTGIDQGSYFLITQGTAAGEAYVVSTTGTIVFGTTNITFGLFSLVALYTAGTGLSLAANNQFSISNTAVTAGSYGNGDAVATFTVNGQGQLTAASNAFITANAANLTGTTLNSSIVTSSLTSVGTLGNLTVTGNTTSANFVGNLANGTSNVSIVSNANVNISSAGNANILTVTGTGANVTGTFNASGNANVGNLGTAGLIIATGNISGGNISATSANLATANVNTSVILGNSTVTTTTTWASVTTTAVTANQTISSFSVTGVTGAEFLVKGVDAAGSKYTIATVQAVTDGSNVDYTTFAGGTITGTTGTLAVNVVGGFLRLQVTPSSSNSIVWTTQYRLL